ncbi:MAG: DNA polymerase III subunit delta [Cyanobacteria bacterium]|nr:DNA polymerase III subunit delta [Cyanobacteriota bacterium]
MPILILAGDEDFILERRLAALKKTLIDPTWASFNYHRFDKADIVDVIDNAKSVPFGPGNKVIVFERCDMFTKKRGKDKGDKDKASSSKDAKTLEHLEQALSIVMESTYLIFSCPYNFDESLKLSKVMQKFATIERFPKTKYYTGSSNPTLETWVRKEAKANGATIDDEAISYLLDGTEANLRQISKEIEKASTFILPATHITYKVVEELSPHHSHVFSLLEYWLSGDSKNALASVNELLSRQAAMQVIATLQTFLGRWIEMKSICDSGNSQLPGGPGIQRRELPLADQVRRVSSELKLKPFMVEKDLKRLKGHSTEKLIEKRRQLTYLEEKVKSGQAKERNALELFLAS